MSSNNLIQIREFEKYAKVTSIMVEDIDAETGELNEVIGETESHKEALIMAENFMKENEVEYGISFKNLESKNR